MILLKDKYNQFSCKLLYFALYLSFMNDIITDIDRINSTIHDRIVEIGVDKVYAGLPDNIRQAYDLKAFKKAISRITEPKTERYYTKCIPRVDGCIYTLHHVLKQLLLTEKELFEEEKEINDDSSFLIHLDAKIDNQYNSLHAKFDEIIKQLEPDHRQSLKNINGKLRTLIYLQEEIVKKAEQNITTINDYLKFYCWQGLEILPQKLRIEFMQCIPRLSSTDDYTFIYLLCSILVFVQALEFYLKKLKNMDEGLIKGYIQLSYLQSIKIRISSILKIYSSQKNKNSINEKFNYYKACEELLDFCKSTSSIFTIPVSEQKNTQDLYEFLKDAKNPERYLLRIYFSTECIKSIEGLTQKLEDMQFDLFST